MILCPQLSSVCVHWTAMWRAPHSMLSNHQSSEQSPPFSSLYSIKALFTPSNPSWLPCLSPLCLTHCPSLLLSEKGGAPHLPPLAFWHSFFLLPLSLTSQSLQRQLSRPVSVVGVGGLKVLVCVSLFLLIIRELLSLPTVCGWKLWINVSYTVSVLRQFRSSRLRSINLISRFCSAGCKSESNLL